MLKQGYQFDDPVFFAYIEPTLHYRTDNIIELLSVSIL
jgi:hypothetical protein